MVSRCPSQLHGCSECCLVTFWRLSCESPAVATWSRTQTQQVGDCQQTGCFSSTLRTFVKPFRTVSNQDAPKCHFQAQISDPDAAHEEHRSYLQNVSRWRAARQFLKRTHSEKASQHTGVRLRRVGHASCLILADKVRVPHAYKKVWKRFCALSDEELDKPTLCVQMWKCKKWNVKLGLLTFMYFHYYSTMTIIL